MRAFAHAPTEPRRVLILGGGFGGIYAALTDIGVEAPLSGMSMNPARTLGSAFHARQWTALWVYFTAPPLGMLAAAELYHRLPGAREIFCAKLHHDNDKRCNLPLSLSNESEDVMNRISTLITAAAGLAERVGNSLQWLSPAIARLTVGLVFFQSGWGKLHDLEKVTNYFTELGIAAPAFQARLASTAEFVCGGLLLVGFATRFAVVPLIVTMCVAIRTALWEQVDGLGSLVGLTEFAYIALLVWLGTHGAGPLSLDWLVGRGAERFGTRALPATAAASRTGA